jgi:hypothetical protein
MKRRLGRRDVEFLMRIVPHGHVTLEIVRQWYPWLSQSAAGSWIKRLRKSGYLESAPLDQRRYYYRLSNKAVLFLRQRRGTRVSRAATRPLKPYRKPEKHAFLVFTSKAHEPPRIPFRPCLDQSRFDDVSAFIQSGKTDPLRQKLFYAAGAMVGYFVLDRGHPAFIKRKLKPKVFSLLRWGSFQRLMAEGNFRLTIVTTSESRRSELEQDIKREPPPFSYEISVLEEIAALLPTRILDRVPQSKAKEKQE